MDCIYTDINHITEGISFFTDSISQLNSLLLSLGFGIGDSVVLASNDVGEITLRLEKLFIVLEVDNSSLKITGYSADEDLEINSDMKSIIESTLKDCIASISKYEKPIRAVFFHITDLNTTNIEVACYKLFTGEYDIYVIDD